MRENNYKLDDFLRLAEESGVEVILGVPEDQSGFWIDNKKIDLDVLFPELQEFNK